MRGRDPSFDGHPIGERHDVSIEKGYKGEDESGSGWINPESHGRSDEKKPAGQGAKSCWSIDAGILASQAHDPRKGSRKTVEAAKCNRRNLYAAHRSLAGALLGRAELP